MTLPQSNPQKVLTRFPYRPRWCVLVVVMAIGVVFALAHFAHAHSSVNDSIGNVESQQSSSTPISSDSVSAPAASSEFAIPASSGVGLPTTASSASSPVAKEWFNAKQTGLLVMLVVVSALILVGMLLAQAGWATYIRPIAALQAIEEAVGRATEMGKPVLFVPGIMDINEIQTVAGLSILSKVASCAAEFETPLEVPTARSLVMTAAREIVEAACLQAGRPKAFEPERIQYVTDEQFAYVAQVCGKMARDKPAACFLTGMFFAESLVLAEAGNAIGAIQIAGTAETSQLPFFVAACDYTLIGEEFYAAAAYLSKEPAQLGCLKGQDWGKLVAAVLLILGCGLATLESCLPGVTEIQGVTKFYQAYVLGKGQ